MPKKYIAAVFAWIFTALVLNLGLPAASSAQPQSGALPSYPAVLKSNFMLGLGNLPEQLGWMTGSGATWDARYQYLTRDYPTGQDWTSWYPGGGGFASDYMTASFNAGYLPVFTYYNILGYSAADTTYEGTRDYLNLNTAAVMLNYFTNFKLLMDKAKLFNKPVIVHVEPDLWGFMQKANPNPTQISAIVGSSGYAPVAAYPNTVAGFAQALTALRNTYAPNVLLAYHVSTWGSTQGDVGTNTNPYLNVSIAAQETANFYNSLGANFDLLFYDIADRDSAYYQLVLAEPGRWWDTSNASQPSFSRFHQFAAQLTQATNKRAFLWQVPIGNTIYCTMDNSSHHYQDNRVQYYLGGNDNSRLQELADAGIIGVLFGPGVPTNTTYYDAAGDGVTNPLASGCIPASLPDDDGGFLRLRAQAYYARQAVVLRLADPTTLVTVGAPTATQVALRWNDNSTNETGFKIEAKIGAGGTFGALATTGATAGTGLINYNATGLLNGTSYAFRVRAYAGGTNSAYTNETALVTTIFPAPTIQPAMALRSSQVKVTWLDTTNSETGFRVERSVAGGPFELRATVGAGSTTFTDIGLSADTLYAYRVIAFNSYGDSQISGQSTLTTPPAEPTNLTATASGTQINLTWAQSSSNGVSGFKIDRKIGINGSWQADWQTPGSSAISQLDSGPLTPGTIYFYRIRANSTVNGPSGYSNEASAIIPGGVIVNNSNDSGPNSLRDALLQAQSVPGTLLTFDAAFFNNSGVTISLNSALPYMATGTTIGGFCDNSTGPRIKINGNGQSGPGLDLRGGATIYGIEVYGFDGNQLKILPSNGNNKFYCTKTARNG